MFGVNLDESGRVRLIWMSFDGFTLSRLLMERHAEWQANEMANETASWCSGKLMKQQADETADWTLTWWNVKLWSAAGASSDSRGSRPIANRRRSVSEHSAGDCLDCLATGFMRWIISSGYLSGFDWLNASRKASTSRIPNCVCVCLKLGGHDDSAPAACCWWCDRLSNLDTNSGAHWARKFHLFRLNWVAKVPIAESAALDHRVAAHSSPAKLFYLIQFGFVSFLILLGLFR